MSTSMTTPLRIALGHKARTGKDTFADHFIETRSDYPTTRLAFATRLYETCARVQQTLDKPMVKDPLLLQTMGQGLKSVYGQNVWVDPIEATIKQAGNDHIIVTDLRYPAEWDMLRRHGFIMIKVNRPDRPIDRDSTHISETALDDYEFDHVIENIGTRDEYLRAIDDLITRI